MRFFVSNKFIGEVSAAGLWTILGSKLTGLPCFSIEQILNFCFILAMTELSSFSKSSLIYPTFLTYILTSLHSACMLAMT